MNKTPKAWADRYLVTNPAQRASEFILRTARQENVHGQWFLDVDSHAALALLWNVALNPDREEAQ